MAKYEKGELIEFLITNSDQFSEDDRKNLETFNEDQLELIAENAAIQIENKKGKSCKEDEKSKDDKEEDMAENELTPDELFQRLPAEHQAIMNEALELRQTRKTELVKAIVANKSNKFTEQALNAMDMKSLENIAALALPNQQKSIANYFGAQGGVSVDNSELDQEGLDMPTLNFEQMSKVEDNKKGVA